MAIFRNLFRICDLTIRPETRVFAGIRIFAAFEVAIIIETLPLWLGFTDFPQVPLWRIETGVWPSRVFLVLLLQSAACIALTGRLLGFTGTLKSRNVAIALVAGLALIVLNQHRLQAWHWLFVLNMGCLLIIPGKEGPSLQGPAIQRLAVMRQTICTVYVCSALSRISPNPASGMNGAIVYQLLALLGVTGLAPDSVVPAVLCHALTLGELLVGLLIMNRRTRQCGCLGAVLLHVSLLVVLGPLGLNHHAGVLLWNLCFLGVVPVLFWGKDDKAKVPGHIRTGVTRLLIAAIWLFPLSGLIGFADNWPSWQLYSTRPESWVLFIHGEDRSRVPEPIAGLIGEPAPLSEWCPVKADRWSLEQTDSPMYPEDRFQLAVVSWILNRVPDDARFQIQVSEPVVPFWWKRRARVITTRAELQQEHNQFLLNSVAVP